MIRALEPADGLEIMSLRRNMEPGDVRLTKGPGALSVALGLKKHLTGSSLYASTSDIWIEDRDIILSPDDICTSPRIGVDYAGECAQWPWRFYEKGNRYVSGKKVYNKI